MHLTLIAAMSENRVIGREGDLPWSLPDDMRHFMRTTRGHTVIMGRRTWASMDGALRHRRNVVITRQPDFVAEGAEVVGSLDAAIALVAADTGPAEPVFIIGGGEIYRQSIDRADRLDLTIVHATIDGDTTFPEWSTDDWRVVSESDHAADDRHDHAFTFRVYERA
ncbi:MAG: dihydrofolate reductase [Phycisphaerales bacterium]